MREERSTTALKFNNETRTLVNCISSDLNCSHFPQSKYSSNRHKKLIYIHSTRPLTPLLMGRGGVTKLDFCELQVVANVTTSPKFSIILKNMKRDDNILHLYIYTDVKQNIEHFTMMHFQSRVSSLCSPRPQYRRRPRYPMRKSPTVAARSLSYTYTTTPGRSWASYTRGASTPANPRPPIVT